MGIVTDHLSAEYLMREGTGTVLNDTSGNGYTANFYTGATFSGTNTPPTWVALGLQFSNSSYVQLDSRVLANDNTSVTDFSVDIWFNPSTVPGANDYRDFCVMNDFDVEFYHFGFTNAQAGILATPVMFIHFGVNDPSGNPNGSIQITSTKASYWTNIIYTRVGQTMSLYMRGAVVGANQGKVFADDYVPSPVLLGGNKYLGTWPQNSDGNKSFEGTIGEIRFYTKGLSEVEAITNYNARCGVYGLSPMSFPLTVSGNSGYVG